LWVTCNIFHVYLSTLMYSDIVLFLFIIHYWGKFGENDPRIRGAEGARKKRPYNLDTTAAVRLRDILSLNYI
jgi:hypothetical protein